MDTDHALPQSVIAAFHLMWGNFPEPASLVHKSREVVAINKAHEKLGLLKPGMNCAKIGSPEMHKGCLAGRALSSREAAYRSMRPGKDAVAFWLPLDGHPEFYVHFGVGTFIDYHAGAACPEAKSVGNAQA